MLKIDYTAKFRKDLKRMEKQHFDVSILKSVILTLSEGKPLDEKYNDHPLFGNSAGHRECHLKFDRLLVYAYRKDTLVLVRTGTHQDVFGE